MIQTTISRPAKPATPQTYLTRVENNARNALNVAGVPARDELRNEFPSRSGRTRKGIKRIVSRTPTGLALTIKPTGTPKAPNGVTPVQTLRWLDGGTGIYGPKGHVIAPRRKPRMTLPGGKQVATVKGQRALKRWDRARPRIEQEVVTAMDTAGHEAADDVARLLR